MSNKFEVGDEVRLSGDTRNLYHTGYVRPYMNRLRGKKLIIKGICNNFEGPRYNINDSRDYVYEEHWLEHWEKPWELGEELFLV